MWLFHLLSHVWLSGSRWLPLMLLLLWAGTKWKALHRLTGNRKRWVSNWGYFALAEQIAFAGLSLARYFPDYAPAYLPYWAGGLVNSALYTLHIHDVSPLIEFLFVFSLAAMGEITIMGGLAALAWWVYSCLSRKAGTDPSVTTVHRYGISLLLSACALGIANQVHSMLHPVTSHDFFSEHGFPLHYYNEGAFGVGERVIWSGLLADIFIPILLGTILGQTWNWVSRRHF